MAIATTAPDEVWVKAMMRGFSRIYFLANTAEKAYDNAVPRAAQTPPTLFHKSVPFSFDLPVSIPCNPTQQSPKMPTVKLKR